MIVAMQKGMEATGDLLRRMGYEVVTYGEYKYPIDALVYKDAGGSAHTMQWTQAATATAAGILMVNAADKSVSEIDAILKRRLYTPLF